VSAAWNKGLQTGVKVGNVPTDRVGPIIAQLVAERWPKRQHPDGEEWGLSILAEKIDCSEDAIDNIIRGGQPGAEFDLVDQIFCALGRPDILDTGVLSDVYWSVDLTRRRCAAPGCSRTFRERIPGRGGSKRVYCSSGCKSNHHRWLNGAVRGGIKQKERCRRGHLLTPENRYKDGRCKTCRSAYFTEKRLACAA
jgi:hypothetical protein